MSISFKNKEGRSSLVEGVRSGLGFCFCKRENKENGKDDVFVAIHPMSSCKDYLNDVVFSENTGKPMFKVHGLSTKKTGVFESDALAYIALGILKDGFGNPNNFDDMVKMLMAYTSDEALVGKTLLINKVETAIGLPDSELTRFYDAGGGIVIAAISKFWVDATFKISLWSYLVRCGLKYKGEDVFDFVVSSSLYGTTVSQKIKKVIRQGFPKQDMDALHKEGNYHVHNAGISSCEI